LTPDIGFEEGLRCAGTDGAFAVVKVIESCEQIGRSRFAAPLDGAHSRTDLVLQLDRAALEDLVVVSAAPPADERAARIVHRRQRIGRCVFGGKQQAQPR